MLDDTGNPFDGLKETAGRVRQGARFGEVPYHRQCEAGEGVSDYVVVVRPRRQSAAAVGESADRRREASRQGFTPLPRIAVHFVGAPPDSPNEGAQYQQLPIREERAPRVEAVTRYPHAQALLTWRRIVRQAERHLRVQGVELIPFDLGDLDFVRRWQAVLLAPLSVDDDGRHAGTQSPGTAGRAQVLHRGDRAATGTGRPAPAHRTVAEPLVVFAPSRRVPRSFGHVLLDVELDVPSRRRAASSPAGRASPPSCTASASSAAGSPPGSRRSGPPAPRDRQPPAWRSSADYPRAPDRASRTRHSARRSTPVLPHQARAASASRRR